MAKIKINGKTIEAPDGALMIDVALENNVMIPHFCYHKKLSLSASCRMCLVEVAGVNKLVSACTTPITDGMIIDTHSQAVKEANKSVLTFLLANHPLDCPVCDKGGECSLQDYTMTCGPNASSFPLQKRINVIPRKTSLLALKDMSRCILCTRCLRFMEEIADIKEFSLQGRSDNNHLTLNTTQTITSELSGNLIDICPVGAITSQLFRFKARSWELDHHKSISPHDGMGSNLDIQTLRGQIMRIVPYENEAINECWLSDRDRFSYEALTSETRLKEPRLKQGNKWYKVNWQMALDYVSHGLQKIKEQYGADSIGVLVSPQATTEELFLLKKLVKKLGSSSIESRLAQPRFNDDNIPWLGQTFDELQASDDIFVIGSVLRCEMPLLAMRLRRAVKQGLRLSRLGSIGEDWLVSLYEDLLYDQKDWIGILVQLAQAISRIKKIVLPLELENYLETYPPKKKSAMRIRRFANYWINSTGKKVIMLGNQALAFAQSKSLYQLAQWISLATNAKLSVLTPGANATGATLVKAYPDYQSGVNLEDMSKRMKAILLYQVEPREDIASPEIIKTLENADMVVNLSPFIHSTDLVDAQLPIAPWSETSGTFINIEGKVQTFGPAVMPLGDTRPGWKVIRVLADFLSLDGFNYNTFEEVKNDWQSQANLSERLNNYHDEDIVLENKPDSFVFEMTPTTGYDTDMIVRRAKQLQNRIKEGA